MSDFEKCLKSKKIWENKDSKKFVAKEIEQAKSDLNSAKESKKTKNYKWATIQAYYSMFHSARSILYHIGYRERNHFCLVAAIREL